MILRAMPIRGLKEMLNTHNTPLLPAASTPQEAAGHPENFFEAPSREQSVVTQRHTGK